MLEESFCLALDHAKREIVGARFYKIPADAVKRAGANP
jgi:hypothetical protein